MSWDINGVTYRIDPRYRDRMAHDYDAPLAAFLRARVLPGACCVDVGANVGVYVLQFAHWSEPEGRVIAFEPNQLACEVLERHVAMNGLGPRVTLVQAAVAASPGTNVLYAAGVDGMSRLGAPNPLLQGAATPVSVPVTTLDEYCAAHGLAPDWLLIDIEGFEFAALSGARRLLSERGAALGLIVEMHPDSWCLAGWHLDSAQALLAALGREPVPLTGQTDPLGEHGLVYLQPNA